jgi:hypothetical protein
MIATGWGALRPLRRLITRLAAGDPGRSLDPPRVSDTLSGPAHTPPEDRNGPDTTPGESRRVRPENLERPPEISRQAAQETIECCACGQLLEDRTTARVWMAPDGMCVAADLACLLWLGETELGLSE